MKTQSMTAAAAGAIGRAIADGKARELGGEVIGPWTGSREEMLAAVDGAGEDGERLATLAYQAACRRWAELVLVRASVRRARLGLADDATVVGQRLADGTFAWPGDQIEWVDPLMGGSDGCPWVVVESWDGGCLLRRAERTGVRLFGQHAARMVVTEERMAHLARWRAS